MDPAIRHLFVYGTLRPSLAGAAQQQLIAEFTVAGPATVPGVLYDVGPYPALITGEGTVHGDLLVISNERHLDALDAYEECFGDDPLYRREAAVATRPDGTTLAAWTYYYRQPLDQARLVAGGDYRLNHPEKRVD
jgi:gamma-glutamylcyclotransferase (GGCT)/AIG2-like uncharacterized protein YtfP